MNRRLVMGGCGAVIALAAALRVAGTSVPVSNVQLQANSEARSPAYPPAMGGPDIVQPALLTAAESRKKIVDSADLHAAVSKITTHSPTIDKLAASEALMACAYLRPKSKREPAELAAAQELATRCAGIHQDTRRDGALEKAVELRASAEDDSSALGRLAALSQRSDTRKAPWHTADLALISDALRSSDSVLVSEAIRALYGQLNDGSPDSKLRTQAFGHAADFHALDRADQRTVFDALIACVNLGCSGNDAGVRTERDMAVDGVRERSEIERLVELYRLALRRDSAALELLAIR